MKTRLLWLCASFLMAFFLIWLWQCATDAQLLPAFVLPSPVTVGQTILAGVEQDNLLGLMWATSLRMLEGWFLASVLGVLVGSAIGMSPSVRSLLTPTLEMLRPIPATAILPVALSIFGLTEGMVMFTIAFAAGWPTLLASVHAFTNIEPRHREVAKVMGFGMVQSFWKIHLPSALPDIFAATRISMTISLIVATLGEFMATKPGIGNYVFYQAQLYRAPQVFAGIVLICVIALVTTAVLNLAERKLLAWNVKR